MNTLLLQQRKFLCYVVASTLVRGVCLITSSQSARVCKIWMLLATETANSFYMSVCKVQKGQALLGSLSQNPRGGAWDRKEKKKKNNQQQRLGGNLFMWQWGNWVTPTAYKAQIMRHPPFLPFQWVVNFSFLVCSSSWLPYQKDKGKEEGGGEELKDCGFLKTQMPE